MTKNSNRQKCGECDHALKMTDPTNIGSENLNCCLNPPTALLVVKGNNLSILNVRPQVQKDTACCVFYTPKAQMLV